MDAETLAVGSKYVLVIGGIVLAIVAALGLRWEDQVDERREIREEEYKRSAGKEIADAKTEAARANENAALANERAANLELETAKQQERAAKAEKALLELQRAVRPRSLDPSKLLNKLKGKPKAGAVDILYKEDDEEAFGLAIQIWRCLGGNKGDGAGWPVVGNGPRPLTKQHAVHPDPSLPTFTRAGAFVVGTGVMLSTPNLPKSPFEDDVPVCILWMALQEAGVRAGGITHDPSLPPNAIRVIVGPKV